VWAFQRACQPVLHWIGPPRSLGIEDWGSLGALGSGSVCTSGSTAIEGGAAVLSWSDNSRFEAGPGP